MTHPQLFIVRFLRMIEIQLTLLLFTLVIRPMIYDVAPNDCDNDRQPEVAIWPPKPEALIALVSL